MKRTIALWCTVLAVLPATMPTTAADWMRFRGPNGSGVSEETGLPQTWDDTRHVRWRTPLPGPGASSPIIVADRAFVTCYTGYGLDARAPGNIEDLKRHLLCVDRADGHIVWTRSVDAVQPEDPYRGSVTDHGYATNTPVSDGRRVIAFFGKSGVVAFDFDGKQLWQADVGHGSNSRRWGSAASLTLCGDLVIVNASEESQSIRALDRRTGQEIWQAKAGGLAYAYGTPAVASGADGEWELVLAVPGEVWGFNPLTGKLRWFAESGFDSNVSPSVVVGDGIVYATGGYRRCGTIAVRAGGQGDVTHTHVLWTSRQGSYIPSPVLHAGYLYGVDERGRAFCLKADTGEVAGETRLPVTGHGNSIYASVLLADGRLYAVSRQQGTFVLTATPELSLVAHNRLDSDSSRFDASPATSSGELFLRSDRMLYCLSQKTGK